MLSFEVLDDAPTVVREADLDLKATLRTHMDDDDDAAKEKHTEVSVSAHIMQHRSMCRLLQPGEGPVKKKKIKKKSDSEQNIEGERQEVSSPKRAKQQKVSHHVVTTRVQSQLFHLAGRGTAGCACAQRSEGPSYELWGGARFSESSCCRGAEG